MFRKVKEQWHLAEFSQWPLKLVHQKIQCAQNAKTKLIFSHLAMLAIARCCLALLVLYSSGPQTFLSHKPV